MQLSHGHSPHANAECGFGGATPCTQRLRLSQEAFRQAVRLNPHYGAAYYGLGTVCLELGEAVAACDALERAVALDERSLGAWCNLQLAAQAAGRKRLARRAWRALRRCSRDDAEALYLKSLAAYNRGLPLESIALYRAAYARYPQEAPTYGLLCAQLERERRSLRLMPSRWERWQERVRWVRPMRPGLVVGASVAAGVTLALMLPLPEGVSSKPQPHSADPPSGEASVASTEGVSLTVAQGVANAPKARVSERVAGRYTLAYGCAVHEAAVRERISTEQAVAKTPPADEHASTRQGGGSFGTNGLFGGLRRSAYGLNQRSWDGDYNFAVGPVRFSMFASEMLSYNDNIGLTPSKESDVIFTSTLGTTGVYPVSDFNTLRMTGSVSYLNYLHHKELNGFNVNVGSGSDSRLELEVLLDQITLHLYDSIGMSNDPYQEAALSGLKEFKTLQNTLGLEAVWDLSDLQLVGDLSRTNTMMLGMPSYDYLDRGSNQIATTALFRLQPWLKVGVRASQSWTDYDKERRSDAVSRSLGPVADVELSDHMSFNASLQRSWMDFERDTRSNTATYTGALSLKHKLNAIMTETFTMSRTLRPAVEVTSNFVQSTSYDYNYTWQASSLLAFSAGVGYQTGKEQYTQPYSRMDYRLRATYQLSQQSTLSFGAMHANKETPDGRGEYSRNLLDATLGYKF